MYNISGEVYDLKDERVGVTRPVAAGKSNRVTPKSPGYYKSMGQEIFNLPLKWRD